jgi:Ca2+-transporting ATPase
MLQTASATAGPPPYLIRHARVPGRLRVEVPTLRGDRAAGVEVSRALAARPGVGRAEASATTGTLLILFDPTLPVAHILSALHETLAAGPSSGTPARPPPAGSPETMPAWHAEPPETAVRALETSASIGLDEESARARLARYGANALPRQAGRHDLAILLDQLRSLPMGLLAGSAVISLATGGLADAVAILAVVAVNAGLGFLTERQAERTIGALDGTDQPDAVVRRAGIERPIVTEHVVPGDLIVLRPSTIVAADARLVSADGLAVNEAVLTGESLPSAKGAAVQVEDRAALGDRVTMVYRGTAVTSGSGLAVVVATGERTEMGSVQRLAGGSRPPQTPMQRQLDRMSRQLVVASLGAVVAVVGIGLIRRRPLLEVLKTAVSLAVAALPEGLPTVATTTMASGIRTMRGEGVLIRRLDALENLGSLGVVCFDKTGTLTENRLAVTAVVTAAGRVGPSELACEAAMPPDARELLRLCALCSEAEPGDGDRPPAGSATERALLQAARDAGVELANLRREWPIEETLHRSETRRYMLTRHTRADGVGLVAAKGSPPELLALCDRVVTGSGERPLDGATREWIIRANDELAGEGCRVLGVARGESDAGAPLAWAGIVALSDPIRAGTREVISAFHQAGIRTVMITGDQSATAHRIARDIGLADDGPVEILDSGQLDRLDEEMFGALAANTHVFARVSPSSKLHIIRALQRGGQVVGMTGDGVNDSPALRAADVGVAMGTGAEAAHQVADVVLRDDGLEAMLRAVRLGRANHLNVRKALRFLLATNLSETLVTVVGSAVGRGQPLAPMQLLWLNLVTDVFPALALAREAPEPRIMAMPPLDPLAEVLDRDEMRRIAVQGGMLAAVGLAGHLYGGVRPAGSGVTVTAMVASQLLYAISSRSSERVRFDRNPFAGNVSLGQAVLGLAAAQALATVLPGARRLLGLQGTSGTDVLAALGAAAAGFAAIEAAGKSAPLSEKERAA